MKKILFIAVLALSCVVAQAQVQFTASAKKVVAVGERFRLTFSVNAQGNGFQAPNLVDFQILAGPSPSTSSSIQIINGQMSQSVNMSFSYVLAASKEGKFTIKPAQITVDGKTYKSNQLDIEVVKGSPQQQQQAMDDDEMPQQQAGAAVSDADMFVRTVVNKTSVYQGEPIVVQLKVYTKLPLRGFKDYKFPSFSGFYSQVIEEPQNIELERENVNGQIYETGLFKKVLLYPQKSGKITIEPFQLNCIGLKRVRPQSFFDDGYREFTKQMSSKPVVVDVKFLPSGAPAGFSGAVGEFSFEAKVNKTKVKTNDAINLKIKIAGTGNLKLVDPGKPELPSDFETYDPKISESIKNSESGSSGSKLFDYLLIPRHAGKYTIPGLAFTYFSIKEKKYKTITSDDIVLEIEKGAGDEQSAVVQGYTKEDVKMLGNDIRFIKTGDLMLEQKTVPFYGSYLFWFCYIIPLFLLLVIVIVRRKQIAENQNLAKVKNKNANKVSKKRLKQAAVCLKSGKDAQYYEELMRALWGYMGDKLNIEQSRLSKETVIELLSKGKVEQQIIDEFINILNQCEFARFAPSAVSSSKEQLYEQASDVINKIEQQLKY